MKIAHRNFYKDESGIAAVFAAIALPSLVIALGLAVDVGLVFYAKQRLKENVRLAAIEGAAVLNPMTGTTSYYQSAAQSVLTANAAQTKIMTVKTPTIVKACLNTVKNLASISTAAIGCTGYDQANAVTVTQTATVNLAVLSYLRRSIDISATSTAGANIGGLPSKMNIMIVLDTTQSMTQSDSSCGKTKIACALAGIQTILSQLNPLYQQVGLVIFPPLTSATNVGNEFCNPSGTLSSSNIAKYSATSPGYVVLSINSTNTGNQTGYSTVVNGKNQLAASSSWGQALGNNSCGGVKAIGGVGTYFADAITAAQNQLIAANPTPSTSGTQNVMFVVSDGDAGASSSNMPTGKATNQCQQAVTAATAATGAGTQVYSLAYGAGNSGCSTDSGLTPCQTMKKIASSAQEFFADSASSCSGATSIPNMSQGFSQGIGAAIKPREIPVGSP